MKRCPKCNSVYTFETVYCLIDGTPLVEESFPLPSSFSTDEEETLISSRSPFIVDIVETQLPAQHLQPPNKNPAPRASPGVTAVLVIGGMLIGICLIVGALYFFVYRPGPVSQAQAKNETAAVSSERHNEQNKTRKDSEFNGYVDTENANIRSTPNSSVADVLPQNDRLMIIERERNNSPWYRVVCEHGVAGWMHGNTIRFNADEESF